MSPNRESALSSADRTAALLAAREARVLSWALLARLVFLAIVTVLTVLQTLELIPPGVIAQGPERRRANVGDHAHHIRRGNAVLSARPTRTAS